MEKTTCIKSIPKSNLKISKESITKLNEKDFERGCEGINPYVETTVYSFTHHGLFPMKGEYSLKVDFSNYYLSNLLKGRVGYITLYVRTGLQGFQERVSCNEFSDFRNGVVNFSMCVKVGDILEMRIFSPIPLLLEMIKFELNLIGTYKEPAQKHLKIEDREWHYNNDVVATRNGVCTEEENGIWKFRIPVGYIVRIKKVVGIEYKFDPNLFLTQGQEITVEISIKNQEFAFVLETYVCHSW